MFNGMRLTNRFEDMRREMDRLIDGFGIGILQSPLRAVGGYPAVNVWDEGTSVCVEAEVPGVKREQLDLYVVGKELTIKGNREVATGESVSYQRRERGTGEFTRVIPLPVEVDSNTIEAKLCDGVLTVRLPKAERARPRQIEVRVG
ncbi:MAG: Hsp20/alpha crystallin family protein [Phycisphaerales bacterium]|nr:Hsp20/alpha crystallin family protein [Phycisphaerales bacterium]